MLLALKPALRRPEPSAANSRQVRFHYSSRVTGGLPPEDLARIIHASWRNNWRFGITGCLHFDGTRFEQVMEGQAESVSYLAAAILADERHDSIDLKNFCLIDERRHQRWVFEGFDRVLPGVTLPTEEQDPTNVIRAAFGARS